MRLKATAITVLTVVLFCVTAFSSFEPAAAGTTAPILETAAPPIAKNWVLLTGTLVTLTTTTPEATIYYTLDGSTPSMNSTKYKGVFSIPEDCITTIKAIAVKAGMNDSRVMTVSYLAPHGSGFQPMDIPITTPTVIIADELHKNLAITQDTLNLNTPVTISVQNIGNDNKINVIALMKKPVSGTITTSALPAINIAVRTTTNRTPVQVAIPAGTTINAPSDWGGTIYLPVVEPDIAASYLSSLTNTTVNTVIEVGCGNVPLTFNKAVRLLIPDQAGKSVGYYRNGVFTQITRICDLDNQNWADFNIPDGSDGVINVGNDLVIWTKHFTEFFTYTQTIPVDGGITPVPTGVNSIKDPATIAPMDNTAATGNNIQNNQVTLTDINSHWAQNNINKLMATGCISGYPDLTFRPNNPITKAEFVTLLVNAFKLAPRNSNETFTNGHWARDSIATAAANGIVNGYDTGTFGPDDLITREQMAMMIVKATKLAPVPGETQFADSIDISDWAREAVATTVTNGIIKGYPDHTFKPQDKASRAEAVTVIANMLK
ncbi:Cellulosome-anchoring protein precursor [Pelotomaculum schinkii]|uniref:Cellulosome-anchoring protein n=1 Tax=Pelotomaculum schinkii TaxID=78350 RepID=A0A4Y7RJG2_9FIRM|nr:MULTISPECIES: S-layer homology domain-containing protein [Pelotomaculum]TEB08467.1 Cellulosome-anchoring protein precursor [Pelotomaculum schinkii]TEB17160.1 Cellulosome-anchoring protein precursor [Pelotomaculum sp. FP]